MRGRTLSATELDSTLLFHSETVCCFGNTDCIALLQFLNFRRRSVMVDFGGNLRFGFGFLVYTTGTVVWFSIQIRNKTKYFKKLSQLSLSQAYPLVSADEIIDNVSIDKSKCYC